MAEQKRSAELEEIWSLFAQEGKENLELAEEALLKLERTPDDQDQIKALFRAIHSYKGGARMMGLGVLESLAHHAEDLMALVRDNGVRLQSDMIELLLSVMDRLRAMLDRVLAEGHDVDPEEATSLIEMLQKTIASYAPSTKSVPPVQAQPSETPAPAGGTKVESVAEPTPAPTDLPGETDAPPVAATNATSDLTPPDDPAPLAEFLGKTEGDLALLHTALDSLASGAPDALAQIQSMAGDLKGAAQRMGYERLVSILEGLDGEARADTQDEPTSNENAERLLRLKKFELGIFEELTNIQDHATPSETAEASRWTDIAWLFRHWNAERVYADLARLAEIADGLDELTKHFTVETMVSRQSEKSAEEARLLLKATYHSCIFYHLDQAVYLSLALADIFGRIVQGELIVNEVLTRLTHAYVTNLGSAIDAIREGVTPPLEEFAALIEQAQNFLYLHTDGPVFQITRSVLDVLNLPAEFKQVMTPETMTNFSRALQTQEHFFTILADLERDETLGAAFLTWSQSEGIHLLTNITVYRYNRTLFNFLLATPLSRDDIFASLAKMDPQWQYLTLEECTLREQVNLAAQREEKPTHEIEAETGAAVRGGAGVSTEVIENISETISTMVADHATLRRVLNRLTEKDLLETVLRTVRDAKGNEARTRRDLEDCLKEWTDEIHTLSQVESQASAALVQMQETTRSLRLVPASEMLNPLRRMAHELAQRQGKLVGLDLRGLDVELDRGAIEALAELVRRLVWFAVTQGVEDVEGRRAAGKTAAGRVLVKVTKNKDHAQIVVEDDGRGLDREPIRQRARELGWAQDNGDAGNELDFVLKPGFGVVGNRDNAEGIDLAAIGEQLRARHGRLSLRAEEGKGTHFDIRLPLDLAVVDGMVVRVGKVRYIVPVAAIRRIVKTEREDLVHTSAEGDHTFLRFEDKLVQVQILAGHSKGDSDQCLVLVVEGEHGRTALLIDELIGRQQVLVRPLQGQFADVQDVSGCALLGEGEVGMVLDLTRDLASRADALLS